MNDEALVRKEKLQSFRDAGVDAYPAKSERTAMISVAHETFDVWAEEKKTVTLCGRVMTTRVHGGLLFADLRDASGRLQILLKLDDIGTELFEMFRDRIDPADFVQVTGILFTTQRGEKTLAVSMWKILTKALLSLPDKFHGLSDQEIKYRYRELDLVSNPESLERFRKRSQIVREFRAALDAEGFDEVETPMLQPIAGGATARPFVTHHNALDLDLYLRIAPELYLKRLIVGGFEKVYEIGRQFRNEGIDWSHNPEFTSIEFYWAYQNYEGLMDFTERLISRVLRAVNNGLLVVRYKEQDIDFTPAWPRMRFADAIKDACGIDIVGMPQDQLVAKMRELNIDTGDKTWNMGKLYDELYKEVVRKKQMQPLFVTDYPIEMEPLAKKCDYDPHFVQRFQLVAGGLELLKAYSELNDPIDQLARFNLQQEMREAGDDEAQSIDMTFVRSLEHGMPPTAGWGMGIDRFTMMVTDAQSMKEVILFPTLRPETKEPESSNNEV